MDKGSGMDHFDDGGEADGAGAAVAGKTGSEEEEGGAKAFAAATEEVIGDFADGFDGQAVLVGDFVFDGGEVFADEIEQFPGGEERRDSRPPASASWRESHRNSIRKGGGN
jgi:hypothetical protein